MWEITLRGESRDILYFEELRNSIYNLFDSQVLMAIIYNDQLVFSISGNNDKQYKVVHKLVIETIIKCVKYEYISNNLTIIKDDLGLDDFIISSMVLINLNDEINYANNTTKLPTNIIMRSFVYFRLSKVVGMWRNLINLLNSRYNKATNDLYLDFLKFIASNTRSKEEVLFLENGSNEMLLLDKEKNMLSTIDKLDEIGIIVNLILLAPKKVIINCVDQLSLKIISLITYIFEDKISILH